MRDVTIHRRTVRFAMATAALVGAAFAGALLGADKATAGWNPNYPYCVEMKYDQILDCTHLTWDECQFTANGIGYCRVNPFYAGPPVQTSGYRQRRHRY